MYDPEEVAKFGRVDKGMLRLCEYGEQPEGTVAVRETLEEGTYVNSHGVKFPAKLWLKRRGFTPAGSILRWDDNDTWGVSMEDRNGSTFGQAYLTEAEAREHWKRVTG